MSSFDEYYKKWKEENQVKNEKPYKRQSADEISKSASYHIDNVTMPKIRNSALFKNNKITKTQEKENKQSVWNKITGNLLKGKQSTKKTDETSKVFGVNNNIKNNKNIIEQAIGKEDSQPKIILPINKEFQEENVNPMLYSQKNKAILPTVQEKEEKNDSIFKDVGGLAKLTGLGITSGSKEVLNFIESSNENNYKNYKDLKNKQFLTSKKVDEEDKAKAKIQNNLLLQKNGIKVRDKIETNLVKKAIRDSINKDEDEIYKTQQKLSNPAMKRLGEIAPSMGQMLPGIALNIVNPVLGMSYFTTSAGGGYINDALKRGMTEEQAFKYGTIMGALEGASDTFITGQQINKVSKAFRGKQISREVLDSYGFNIFENAVQEAIMEPAQELTAGIIGGNDKADWSTIAERMLSSGFNGALMGAISNGVTYGLEKSGKVYNKLTNKETVTVNEYRDALNENINKFGKDTVEQNIKQGALETYQEINNATDPQQNTLDNQKNSQAPINYQDNIKQNNNISNKGNLYFRLDDEGGFKGKEHKSGVSMWEEQIDDYIYDIDNEQELKNVYGIEDILELDDIELEKIKREIAEDKGLITDGASAFKLTKEGIEEYLNYIKDHPIDEYKEINFFTGKENGLGADREYIVQPDETIYTNNSKIVTDILEKDTLSNKDKLNKIVEIVNKNTLANNQKPLYNINESVGGNNGEIQEFQRLSRQFDTNIFEKETQDNIRYTAEGYRQFEKSIKSVKEANLTSEQKQKIDNYKRQYNKDIVFFDGEQDYIGGASLEDNGKIYIDRNSANYFGEDKVINHEILESDIRHNRSLSNDIIKPSIDKIIEDPNFQEQKAIFWKNQEGEIPSDYAIAKEILCDRFAELKTGEKWDYDNVLSQETNMTIDYSLDNFYKELNKQNNTISAPITEESKIKLKNNKQILEQKKTSINDIDNNKITTEWLDKHKLDYEIDENNKLNIKDKEELDRIYKEDLITAKEQAPISKNIEEEKIATILEKPPEKVKEKDRKWAIFKANVFDKGIVFEELSHRTKNRELQGKWDYILTATARGQNAIGRARYEFNPETKTNTLISKSLEDIRQSVGENVQNFNNYMYHQLNIDRMTLKERFGGDTGLNYEKKRPIENKPVFGNSITADISKNIVSEYEKKFPKFKEYAQDIYDYNKANMKELIKNGVVSQELADLLDERYPHYIPITRADNKGNAIKVPLDTNRTGINTPIAQAKGGNQDILPLFETMANRTLQTYRASARNNFGLELMNTLKNVQNVEKVDVDNIVDSISNNSEELLTKGKNGNNPTFTVFNQGEKITFEITKDMYDALKPLDESSLLGKTSKLANKISNFRRGILTEYNPVFMITNSVKDIQDVIVNSQHTAKTFSKLPEAYAQIIKKGYWYNEYIQNGGEQNSYFNSNDEVFISDVRVPSTKKVATLPLRAISKANNIIEMSPRLAEYIASREKGVSVETAMLDASRVTTNFKAGGDLTKFANRNGVTFLNASVQGAMQQVRNIKEAKVKGLKGWTVLACKYAIAGLPAVLLNNLLWADDDDYDDLQDYVKDNYYCIAKYGDGNFIRIPKGRATATIQKIITTSDKYLTKGKEINIDNLSKDFWENISFARDNLAPNNPLDNNVISPIIQVRDNKSWYGEDIVPSRLQNKPEAEQYDETTDNFSKWIGEKFNISPKKINYLLDQYGGGISDVLLPTITPQAENNIIEDKFTTDSVMKSKYPGEFFEKNDELKVKSNSSKATDLDKLKHKYMSNISEEMSELYKKKREIQNSNSSDKMKKIELKNVQKKINKLAQDGIEAVDNAKTKKMTAKVGNKEYYKLDEEWKELTEKEKVKDLSLETYADYKKQVKKLSKQKKESEESIGIKDKIKILSNSNYSLQEKHKIYSNFIEKEDKLYNSFISKTNININEYLKYKSQTFQGKKDKSGKTISGSKKKAVYNYINTLNLSSTEKAILFAKAGYSSKQYKSAIYNYINNLNLSANEKKKIWNDLGYK